MTAGELIDELSKYDKDTEVVVCVKSHMWRAIDKVFGPLPKIDLQLPSDRLYYAICINGGEEL